MTGETAVVNDPAGVWFGEAYARLHPRLQELHRDGGRLCGTIRFRFGSGLAGLLGRGWARRSGLPLVAGDHELEVSVGQDAAGLFWTRRFDASRTMRSHFLPEGRWPDGWWNERIGPLQLRLAVDLDGGDWSWRLAGVRWHGIPTPARMLRMTARKSIEAGGYRFAVRFAMPWIGELLAYEGLLQLQCKAARAPVGTITGDETT